MSQTPTFAKNSRYRRFIKDRDKALEAILLSGQVAISKIASRAFDEIYHQTLIAYADHLVDVNPDKTPSRNFQTTVDRVLSRLSQEILSSMVETQMATFALTATSETEALAQALGRSDLKYSITDDALFKRITGDKQFKYQWGQVRLELARIRSRVMHVFESALLREVPAEKFVDQLRRAFPVARTVKRKNIAPVREAVAKKGVDMAVTFLSENLWDAVVKNYKATELPEFRFFNEELGVDAVTGEAVYAWQIERLLTDSFVAEVRAGTMDVGEQNGISDFVWVAVLDAKTDECCSSRDGMLTSEIEEALASGTLDRELCDAIVPPAHPNCRCRLVGASKNIPAQPGTNDVKEFFEWLEN